MDNKAPFMACFLQIQKREMSSSSFVFSANKKLVFVSIVEQEQWLNAAQRVRLCPSKQTLWANQLILPTLVEEWRHYQALAGGPMWTLGQGLKNNKKPAFFSPEFLLTIKCFISGLIILLN